MTDSQWSKLTTDSVTSPGRNLPLQGYHDRVYSKHALEPRFLVGPVFFRDKQIWHNCFEASGCTLVYQIIGGMRTAIYLNAMIDRSHASREPDPLWSRNGQLGIIDNQPWIAELMARDPFVPSSRSNATYVLTVRGHSCLR